MVVYCESRDGFTPMMVNDWGALKCSECAYDSSNRPKFGKDPSPKERCKRKVNIIGIGGDWKDIYVFQIAGPQIIDFYLNKVLNELEVAKSEGEPYFLRTFFLDTYKDGAFHNYQVKKVIPTLRTVNVSDDTEVLWDIENESELETTLETLEGLQKICMQYKKERQEAGKAALKKQLELKNEEEESSEDLVEEAKAMGYD